jgi:hypothetical protein
MNVKFFKMSWKAESKIKQIKNNNILINICYWVQHDYTSLYVLAWLL